MASSPALCPVVAGGGPKALSIASATKAWSFVKGETSFAASRARPSVAFAGQTLHSAHWSISTSFQVSPKAIHQSTGVAVDSVSLKGADQFAGGSRFRTGIATFGAEPQARNRQATTGEIVFTIRYIPEIALDASPGKIPGLTIFCSGSRRTNQWCVSDLRWARSWAPSPRVPSLW